MERKKRLESDGGVSTGTLLPKTPKPISTNCQNIMVH